MDSAQIVEQLKQKIQGASLPSDVLSKLNDEVTRLELTLKSNQFTPEIERQVTYINFVCALPWVSSANEILDLAQAKKVLDQNHYGLEKIKERILEYLSVMILNKRVGKVAHQPILAFVGLVGSGKTSLAYSIAQSLGRPIIRLPFGGLGSALSLRGESRIKFEAEPGLILKALRRSKVNNPVILLDELDRVNEGSRADIMGVLVELLDPEQNRAFLDHYLSFPFDLSNVLFIATANNTGNVATAVLDRLELIEMPFYSDEQKMVIGKNYILPQALENAGLSPNIVEVDANTWGEIVRPLGFDGGIRSLRRNIESMVGKIARSVVEGEKGPFIIDGANLHQYLPV